MAVVQFVEPADADPSLKGTLESAQRRFGAVPQLFKALANNPEICKPVAEFMLESLQAGRVDWGLRELLILRMLHGTQTEYGVAHHERIARELGVPAEKIADVASDAWRSTSPFTAAERTLLEFVDQIAVDANDVRDELWERLKAQWRADQIVEVSMAVTTFLMIGKMGDALGVSDPVLFTKPPKAA